MKICLTVLFSLSFGYLGYFSLFVPAFSGTLSFCSPSPDVPRRAGESKSK